jgi:hypothetical protein
MRTVERWGEKRERFVGSPHSDWSADSARTRNFNFGAPITPQWRGAWGAVIVSPNRQIEVEELRLSGMATQYYRTTMWSFGSSLRRSDWPSLTLTETPLHYRFIPDHLHPQTPSWSRSNRRWRPGLPLNP